MAQKLNGAGSVVATDGAGAMLELARGHESGVGSESEGGGEGEGGRRVLKVDVTSERDLDGLVEEEGRFDVVLMNMAMMDVATLEPLARTLRNLLAVDGV
jgi:hypothetical protein